MAFRKMKSCRKSEREQGLIYYTCLNYARQNRATREKIDRLCLEAGGEYAAALKELLTKDSVNLEGVAMRHYCGARTLWEAKRKFYNLW